MEQPDPRSPGAAAPIASPPTGSRRLTLDELTALAIAADPSRPSLPNLYFRLTGRIPRRTFWMHGVFSLLAVAMLGNAILDIAGLANDVTGKLVNLLLAWPYIAISAKRLHDYNRSPWWLLLNLIPGVGALIMLVANGMTRGTQGPNRYGDDPLDTPARRILSNAH